MRKKIHAARGILAAGLTAGLAAGAIVAPVGSAFAADAAAALAPSVRVVPQRPEQVEPAALPPTQLHPNAAAGLAMPYAGKGVDVTTYHNDSFRTGWNSTETALTPASVKSSKFGLLQTLTVDGSVFAQPLVVSGFKFPDGSTHDVLIVVTAHNSVYAWDAQSYAPLWQVNLGKSQATADIGCNDVNPEYGISSTPVVLRTGPGKAALYLVSATEPAKNEFHTTLRMLNLANGKDVRPGVEINPSATMSDGSTLKFDPKNEWSRAGLAYAGGSIYIAIASHCDNNAGAISGWMLKHDARTLVPQKAFNTIQTPAGYQLAAIWMSGFAPAVDTDGSVFAITGNGNFVQGGKDWGESVIKLPPTLTGVTDFFTPAGYRSLNNTDADFGSGGLMLLPQVAGQTAPPMAVGMGKDATMYLLDRTNLGQMKTGDTGALQKQSVAGLFSGIWGGPAYYETSTGPVVYYQVASDVLKSFKLSTGATPSLTLGVKGTSQAGTGGSMPIVSSNGHQAGTGVVWTIRRGSTVALEAYDAETLGAPIYSANAGQWTAGRAFITPLQANGRVYVAASGTVNVFGLTP